VPLPPALAALPRGPGGAPLPGGLRRRLEGLFGVDFSGVQVHHRPEVHAAGALALTRGLDIYFSPGRYDPETPHGLELLGHELTHVVQQCTGRVGTPPGDAGAIVLDAALEAEADRMGRLAARALGGQTPSLAFVPPPAGPRLLPPARDRLQPAAAITYYPLGAYRKLNEIVMVGSHDAGITSGLWNVRTQDLDILGQAEAGARFFDLRIAAQAGVISNKAELKAFHCEEAFKINLLGKKRLQWPDTVPAERSDVMAPPGLQQIKQTKLFVGAFGLGLTRILLDARAFVSQNPTEFLILKFDKCSNWPLIAEACTNILTINHSTQQRDEDNCCLYKRTDNLNTKTLAELRGKVIVLFSEKGLNETPLGSKGADSGIHGWRNLSGKGAVPAPYDPGYHGLQYFGKGGTSLNVLKYPLASNKIEFQRNKQTKLMAQAVKYDPQVIKMIYWTTTGIFNSIRRRNNQMWEKINVDKLIGIWNGCLEAGFTVVAKAGINPASPQAAPYLKAYLPNIVMIDFVDAAKCRTIYNLNSIHGAAELAATALAAQAEEEWQFGRGVGSSGT
jgi:hypothetical protein